MEYKKEIVESNASIESRIHIYICSNEEREEVLKLIKENHPGEMIELTKHGYKVSEIHKKTQEEKDEYFKLHKPKVMKPSPTWEQEVMQSTKGKRR